MTGTARTALVFAWLAGVASGNVAAAELQARSSQAYDAYLDQARRAFLARARADAPTAPAADRLVSAGPAREDGIIGVPGALVHHWIGVAFLRGVPLRRVLDTSRAYTSYGAFYRSIIASRLVARDGDTYQVLMRIKEGEAGVSAVLDVRSTIQYFEGNRSAYAVSDATEIREVKNAGRHDEHLLPAGQDSGYLWRASTFTHFREHDGGVVVEMETLGLSRRFPPLLGWIIEPIARRLGRRSVETSLREFIAAIRAERS